MRFDLHLHTSRHSPDSVMSPEDMLRQAAAIGLDGVVITEHDWLWTEAELDDLRAQAPGLLVFAGIEVSSYQGHVLVYGVQDPFKVPRGIDMAELCREVHRQGGAAVAAHPFRWGQPFRDILQRRKPELDALELMSNNMDSECRRQAAAVAAEHGYAGLGNSDAHRTDVLGCCHTEFASPVRDLRELVEAIRAGQTTPGERLPALAE